MKPWWLRAAFARKPASADTRPFIVRLLASIRVSAEKTKRGITVWIKGGADF